MENHSIAGIRLERISFSGSRDSVDVSASDVVVLVGANNVGKSRALREIQRLLVMDQPTVVVADVVFRRIGTADDLEAWLRACFGTRPGTASPDTMFMAGRQSSGQQSMVSAAIERNRWLDNNTLSDLAYFLTLLADAETRLQLANSTESVDALSDQAIEPLQRLVIDHEAERRLSASVERAFGVPVVVSRAGGTQVHLMLGGTEAEARLDSPEYLQQLRALPLVAEQGDGMRSFIGLILTLTATPYPLVLIDEPEAFLHPPQAREIGRQLGEAGSGQRIVATHSADVLLGILDRAPTATVIRLRRRDDENVPAVLGHVDVRDLWKDPTLRYSNLLEGLFHPGVIICEADGDARLYSAALDAEHELSGGPASDLLFTHCGGKGRLPRAIRALRALDVPVVAIADVDALREHQLLSEIVEALGGSWSDLRTDWATVAAAMEAQPAHAPIIHDVREAIALVLGEDDAARLSERQTRKIRELTKSTDEWRTLKTAGLAGLPRGHAAEAGARLVKQLESLGLLIVPVGELESWGPTLGGHGAGFVAAALDAKLHETSDALRSFAVQAARLVSQLDAQ